MQSTLEESEVCDDVPQVTQVPTVGKTLFPDNGGLGIGLKLFGGQQTVSDTFLPLISPVIAVGMSCG